jgi:hypothetical protein
MIEDAFGPINPQTAQHEMPVEGFAALLAELKPKFIHHAESKRRLEELLSEFGCDLHKTYFDVPRMRTSTSNDYLSSGISNAFYPHRDTWYSAPFSQLNWWIPIYPVVPRMSWRSIDLDTEGHAKNVNKPSSGYVQPG